MVAPETTTAGVIPSASARTIATELPQTLQAPTQDIQQALSTKPVELNPTPAPVQDVNALVRDINLQSDTRVRVGDDRYSDRSPRQWRPDWVQYDEYYRPVLLNPYRDPVRIVYIYQYQPRIVWIPPLARIVLEVAELAAYSFTAIVATAANVVNAAVQTAVDVAVGTFFGGGYFPGVGLPFPAPPPPVLAYDNVPVLVRYSQAEYEPFRVRRIIDVGDDVRYGGRKVLLDGVTPAWGEWTQTSTGERQFEVRRTQQFPGLEEPREAPLPGNYQLRLASDESALNQDRRNTYLVAAALTCAVLALGAVWLAGRIGRRRPQQ